MNTLLSNIESSIVNETKVGDVFILVVKDETGIRKRAHHAILIDVASATDEIYMKGVLLHLTVNSNTRLTKFRFDDKPQLRNTFHDIIYISKVVAPQHIHPTKTWE